MTQHHFDNILLVKASYKPVQNQEEKKYILFSVGGVVCIQRTLGIEDAHLFNLKAIKLVQRY